MYDGNEMTRAVYYWFWILVTSFSFALVAHYFNLFRKGVQVVIGKYHFSFHEKGIFQSCL